MTGKSFTHSLMCIHITTSWWTISLSKKQNRDADSQTLSVSVCVKETAPFLNLQFRTYSSEKGQNLPPHSHCERVKHLWNIWAQIYCTNKPQVSDGLTPVFSLCCLTDCTMRRQVVQSKLINEKLFWLDQNNRSSGYSVMLCLGEKSSVQVKAGRVFLIEVHEYNQMKITWENTR